MTLEELVGTNMTTDVKKTDSAGEALEALVVAAQRQDCLTVGVYESAKLMNVDPDSVVLCVLATDEEDEGDVALQIHFTLLQAFCCDNDIDIVRVAGMRRLAQLLGDATPVTDSTTTTSSSTTITTTAAVVTVTADDNGNEPRDLHCILVTNTPCQALSSDALRDVSSYCEESRGNNQWVPCLALHQR